MVIYTEGDGTALCVFFANHLAEAMKCITHRDINGLEIMQLHLNTVIKTIK